jgi:hypothetical protein
MALAFSGTVATMASCGGDDDNKKNQQEIVYDQGEEGTYCDESAAGNEIVLDDGKFTLTIGEATVTGDYSYDGDEGKIVLEKKSYFGVKRGKFLLKDGKIHILSRYGKHTLYMVFARL